MIASARGGGGGDVRGSQEAPVAALPPLNNLAPRHGREAGVGLKTDAFLKCDIHRLV